jgi:peptidoglycan/LPS O-acetylase OafA/YrhL
MRGHWDEGLKRGNAFDAVRLLLASLVVLEHSYFLADGGPWREPLYRLTHGQVQFGEFAVFMFFTVSGFLVTRSGMTSTLDRYALKRILRIVPGFLVASLVGILIVGPLSAGPGYFAAQNWKLVAGALLGLKQVAAAGAFPTNPLHLVHGALWTVRYEFDCYILIGLLATLGLLKGRTALITFLVLAAMVAVSQLVSPPVIDHGIGYILISSPDQWGRLFPFFFVGSAIYLWREHIPKSPWLLGAAILWLAVASQACGFYWALLFGGSYAVLYAALTLKWEARIGGVHTDLSYGVYLYSWPVQQLIIARLAPGPLATFATALPLTLAVAWLSWTFIEAPALKLAHRRLRPAPIGSSQPSPSIP